MLLKDEQVTDLILGGYKIIQGKNLYRFNIDSVLLAHFADLEQGMTVADLGAGDGVLGLILLARQPKLNVLGIEINEKVADMLRRTIAKNFLQDKYRVVCADIKEIVKCADNMYAKKTDIVICNPPYWKKGTGKISQNSDIACARHEIKAELRDFVAGGAYLLRNGGKMVICHLSERLPELLSVWQDYGIAPMRVRMVHARCGEAANIVLMEGIKGNKKMNGKKMCIMSPMFIYQGKNGEYTDEVKEYYGLPKNDSFMV